MQVNTYKTNTHTRIYIYIHIFIIWLSSLSDLYAKCRLFICLAFYVQTGKFWRENFSVDLKTDKRNLGSFYKRFETTNYQKSS